MTAAGGGVTNPASPFDFLPAGKAELAP